MCLAIPVRIEEIMGQMARVELGGVSREVSLVLTPEAQPGDYVLIHTGYAISVIDEAEAKMPGCLPRRRHRGGGRRLWRDRQ